jgi:hypothetical protein
MVKTTPAGFVSSGHLQSAKRHFDMAKRRLGSGLIEESDRRSRGSSA